MRNIIVFILSFLTINTVSAQWITQTSGTTQHIYDVFFIDTNTGWACGNNGTMLKTTNGGNNWFGQNSGITQPLYSVHFIDFNTGWTVNRTTPAKILKTTDGGNNWVIQLETANASFESVFFLNSQLGWVSGAGLPNQLYKTTNGGTSWDSVSIYPAISSDVIFINTLTGWCCVGPNVFKSTDSGISWFQQFQLPAGEIRSLSFLNINTGWLTTGSFNIYKTTNSGINWILIDDIPQMSTAHSVFFSSANTGWVSGDGGVMYKSTNGGYNWLQENTNTTSFLRAIVFVTDSIGWAVGGGGRIIHTTTSGAVLTVVNIKSNIPSTSEIIKVYPNPFNPVTKINFKVSSLGLVILKVFDMLGKELETLINEQTSPGVYEVEWNGANFSTGIYICKLLMDGITIDIKKMVLVK